MLWFLSFLNWKITALQWYAVSARQQCKSAISIYIKIHTHIYLHMHLCVRVCMCVCMCVCARVYVYPLSDSPSHRVITEPQAGDPLLYNSFPLATYSIQGSVYMSKLLSVCPTSPSPAVSISPSSTSVSLFLPANRSISAILDAPVKANSVPTKKKRQKL